jgi:hypothetical protein
MLYKSSLISQGSGSVAGSTYSHNAGGMYIRSRSIPTNPNTALQQAVRNLMTQLTSAWQGVLTPAQRAAWAVYNENVPLLNRLGDSIHIGALPHYVRSNIPRMQAGLARIDDAPTVFNLGEFSALTFAATADDGKVAVAFENTDDWANEDDAALLMVCSSPQSPSINYFKGPYRYVGKVEGDSMSPPSSPTEFDSLRTLTAGQKLFCQARVSRVDGRLSAPFQGTCTVVAS